MFIFSTMNARYGVIDKYSESPEGSTKRAHSTGMDRSLYYNVVGNENSLMLFQLVTAFAVSATASNWDRIGKPFNPLLGETYELDRYLYARLHG